MAKVIIYGIGGAITIGLITAGIIFIGGALKLMLRKKKQNPPEK